jgi:hypothetical protein
MVAYMLLEMDILEYCKLISKHSGTGDIRSFSSITLINQNITKFSVSSGIFLLNNNSWLVSGFNTNGKLNI